MNKLWKITTPDGQTYVVKAPTRKLAYLNFLLENTGSVVAAWGTGPVKISVLKV